MEGLGSSLLNVAEVVIKKPRSLVSRKPRPKEQLASEYKDLSCAPSRSYSLSVSPDEDVGAECSGLRRKELYLNGPQVRSSSANRADGVGSSKRIRREDRAGVEYEGQSKGSKLKGSDVRRFSEGHLAPANGRSTGLPEGYVERSGGGREMHPSSRDPNGSADNKLRKVKLKVVGVTRTIHAKTNTEMGDGGMPSSSDGSVHRNKHKGDNRRDSSGLNHYHNKKDDNIGNQIEGKYGDKHHVLPSSEPVRKSKRVPKKRTRDDDFDDEDGELRYLEKLKVGKVVPDHPIVYDDSLEDGGKKKKLSKVSRSRSTPYEVDEDFVMSRSERDARNKFKSGDVPASNGEEQPRSDDVVEIKKKKQKEVDSLSHERIEPLSLTTRQRALQGRGGNGASLIEFPHGLPPAPPRKQKDKISEVEKQAKKAEAAQRRKMQVEKAAREAEAEAIRKILGTDSDKKKEEKKQKEREERERKARLHEYKRNSIRCVMGPQGTVVTFPDQIGLPSIFDSKPCSYPPPREKCAGPSCTNPYKYRDSKSKLPLCSLECYRGVQRSGSTN